MIRLFQRKQSWWTPLLLIMRKTGPASHIPMPSRNSFTSVREVENSWLKTSIFLLKKDDLIIVNPHIQHTEISLSASPLSYYTSVWTGSVFPFMIRRNSRSFTAARSTPTFILFSFSFSGIGWKKWWLWRDLQTHACQFWFLSSAVLLSLIFSCFHPFIQAKNAPSSSDIWIPTTAMTSIWNSLPA